ncbi:hypothetical protein NSE01_39490 [Novosphingobium sediminis]|uniref:Uncharacterized protein n=1 Tax=Novosphingobium sediminis TaxID=707214 RepID=A0A512ARD3_9SPHN|nr:hypothetical protein [Novosphingobium sediminis]GEO02117.1 hypothetical protein NSE01_39490 [Novosphingobium sediminis]
MTGRLYLGLDFFPPAFVRPPLAPDDYGHDQAAIHLVVQPMLLRAKDPRSPAAGQIEPLSLKDYFGSWDQPDPARPAPLLIDHAIGRLIDIGEVIATPVPFAPGTHLEIEAEVKTAGGETVTVGDERTIGRTTPLNQPVTDWDQLPVAAVDGWPGFAKLSNALPLVERYEELDPPKPNQSESPRREQLRRSLIGLFTAMWESLKDGNQPDWTGDAELLAFWEASVKPKVDQLPLSDLKAWDQYLAGDPSNPPAPASALYARLMELYQPQRIPADADDPVLKWRPYRFAYRPDQLDGRGDLFDGGLRIAGRSYLHALWSNLKAHIEQLLQAPGADDLAKLQEVEQALGRLYGFGERLAWPIARLDGSAVASRRFMVLRPRYEANWFITNAISLAGQVFRLSPVSLAATPQKVTGLNFIVDKPVERAGGGSALPDLASGLESALTAAAQAGTPAAIQVRPAWRTHYAAGGGTRTDRTVYWHTRCAEPVLLEPPSVPEPVYTLPPSLLDTVDAGHRFVGKSGGEDLSRTSLARRSLTGDDLLRGDRLYIDYRLRLRLAARLEPYLTGESGAPGTFKGYRNYLLRLLPLNEADIGAAAWLHRIVTGARNRAASLWVPLGPGRGMKALEVNSLTASRLSAHPGTAESSPIVLVRDEPESNEDNGALSKILEETDSGLGAPESPHGWDADLVFQVYPGEPFNLLSNDNGGMIDSLQLRRGLVSRIGCSADRLVQSVAVDFAPRFDPDDPVRDTFQSGIAADFNKLRLTIDNFGKDADDKPLSLPLANPDALLPLPARDSHNKRPRPFEARGPVEFYGPHYWYWLSYLLDQDRDTSDLLEERLRLHAWSSAASAPERARAITGYVEHQYGHQVATAPLSVSLARSTDIAHPAHVSIKGLLKAEQVLRSQDEVLARRRALLRFEEGPQGVFALTLGRKAVRLALERYDAGPQADNQDDAEGGWTGALRRIHAALVDLRDAVDSGRAEMILEEWRFDNSVAFEDRDDIDLGEDVPQPTPDILKQLVRGEERRVPVTRAGMGSALIEVIGGLDASLEDFVALLNAKVPPVPREDGDLALDSAWANIASHNDGALHKRAHYVRARLILERPESVAADSSWSEGVFVPLADPDAYTSDEEKRLQATAREELTAFLAKPGQINPNPSRLWRSDTHSEIFPPAAPALKASTSPKPMLGEHEQTLRPPQGKFEPQQRVVDLFYVPYAFLVPAAHPALRDRQGTSDFADYLLEVLARLAEGKPLEGLLRLDSHDAGEAAILRAKAIALLSNSSDISLVAALERLLIRVEPDASSSGSASERALYDKVTALTRRVEAGTGRGSWREVRRALLARRPNLLGNAKGIGLVLFDPPAASGEGSGEQIFSLFLTKRIVRDGESFDLPVDQRKSESERFDFTRFRGKHPGFFVDVLPEAIYDDTLIIQQNKYKNVDPSDFDELGKPRARIDVETAGAEVKRGDASARSAEEVLDPAAPRAGPFNDVETNVVHYNPEWRLKVRQSARSTLAHYFYFLPERRLPSVPRSVQRVFAGANGPLLDKSKIMIARPGERPDLKLAWRSQSKQIFDGLSSSSIPASGGGFTNFGRVPGNLATRVQTDLAPGGWQTVTTYLSHHWFQLGLDRPRESLKANLDDDVIEVEVELWEGVPPPESAPPAIAAAKTTPLLEWFNWWRAQSPDEVTSVVEMPEPVPHGAIVEEMQKWLVESTADDPWFGRTLLDRVAVSKAQEPAKSGRRALRRYRLIPPTQAQNKWQMKPIGQADAPGMGGIGEAVAFEIYAPKDQAGAVPAYEVAPSEPMASVMLRVSILDQAFLVSRVRTRVVRNWKDMGENEIPDLREEFLLADAHSAWSSSDRDALRITLADLESLGVPDKGGSIFVQPGKPRADWLRGWIAGDRALSPAVAQGLSAALTAQLPDATGSPFPLWDSTPMLGTGVRVNGSVVQRFFDTMPRYDLQGRVAVPEDSARHHDSIRQLLPLVHGDKVIGYIGAQLDPAMIRSVEPLFELVWHDRNEKAVLSVTFPMKVAEK